MSEININDTNIIFSDEKNKKIILDINNFIKNKSRIPLHAYEKNGDTIPHFLMDIIRKNSKLFPENTSTKKIACCTANSLIVSELITSAAPIKMAEFGSTKGDISYNLMEILGKFNPSSTLCLISNTIGNESGNNCLNCITQASLFPEFSLLYSDYAKTNLADNCFDIVFINGDACREDHYAVIKEAERITKQGGLLICWTSGDFLLESTFKLVFSEREEYELSPAEKLLTARKTTDCWSNCTSEDPFAALPELLEALQNNMDSNHAEVYRPFVKQLNQYIATAIQVCDIPKKLFLIEITDALQEYMNHFSTKYKDFYAKKLLDILRKN